MLLQCLFPLQLTPVWFLSQSFLSRLPTATMLSNALVVFFQPYLIHSAACITIDLNSSQNPFLSGLSFLQWPLILKLMLIASGFVEIPLVFFGCSQLCLHFSIVQESSQMQGCWNLWVWNSDFGRFRNFPRWPYHLTCTQAWEPLPEVVSFSSMVLRIIITRPDYY